MTEPSVTPLSQSVELQLAGQPDVKNKYGSGRIRPTRVFFYYLPDRITAHLYGSWVREDGELTDAPCDQDYREPIEDWPAWLAALARQYTPAERTTETDTLPAWLHWRFGSHGQPWSDVPDEDKALWEYQARAVRRAVARNGFKTSQPETDA
ncbi:hypothetical protein [Streptomyces sp. NPDC048521]|uniref:hypothetical protein n=1 Tax=Streptomyces sp. NPDC048521 TaxID=3365566 RepID=UPI003722C385